MSNSISAAQSVGQQPVGRIGNLATAVNQSAGRDVNSSLFDLLFQIQVNTESSQDRAADSGENVDPLEATVSSTESSTETGENEVERAEEPDAEDPANDDLDPSTELLAFLNASPVAIEETTPESIDVAEIESPLEALPEEANSVEIVSVSETESTTDENPIVVDTLAPTEDEEVVETEELTGETADTDQQFTQVESNADTEASAIDTSRRIRRTERSETDVQQVVATANEEDSISDGELSLEESNIDSEPSDGETADQLPVDAQASRGRNRRAERLAENRANGGEPNNLAASTDSPSTLNQSGELEIQEAQSAAPVEPFPAVETPEISGNPVNANVGSNAPTAAVQSAANVAAVASSAGSVGNTVESGGRSSAAVNETTLAPLAGLNDSALRSTENRRANKTAEPKTTLTQNQQSRLVQRVLRGFESLGADSGRVKIRLHPESLGSVQLSLEIRNDEVTGRLEVETIAARDALTANLSQLENRLKEQNITLKRFEVVVSDESTSTENRSHNSSEFGGSNQQRNHSNDPGSANAHAARWRHNLGRTARSPAPVSESSPVPLTPQVSRVADGFDIEI